MLRSFRLRKVLVDDPTELNQSLTSAASCPNLLDCIDEGKPVRKEKNKKSPKRYKKRNTTSIIDTTRVNVAISSVEAEDISSLEFQSGMLSRGSRQRSQSLDRLLSTNSSPVPPKSSNVGPFRKETGDSEEINGVHALLENPESATRWYFKYFLGKVHQNFLCYDNEKNPFFLSVVGGDCVYRCILWRKTGNKRLCMAQPPNGKIPPPKAILEKFMLPKYDKTIKEISGASLQKDFLTLEEQEGAVNFKIGVLYAQAGQTTDDEMFSNKTGSPSFNQFLHLLGETVNLQGFEHFKGGLDNKNNATGTQSLYTVFGGHEIMFHVSTMLPYSEDDRQQLERKRHIGNDIVVIIFVDGEDEAYHTALQFNPESIKSHFNHIFALVTYSKARDSYKLVIHSAESVPNFGPPLPPTGEFSDHSAFRDFLLAKLINAEKAAYCTPTFADKRKRTLGLLLKEVEQKCTTELRKSLSSQINGSSSTSRKYHELEQSFQEVGQKLKVEKIVSGLHPTSQRTTANKRDPWETTCVLESFPYKIVCGDTCEDGTLIVATPNDGTFMIFRDGSTLLVIDKSLPIAQMSIAHRHQLVLFRSGHSKDTNHFYAVPLEEFLNDSVKISNKGSLSSYQLPHTKGCHLFCTTPLNSQFLRVMVAVKNKVNMFLWKHLASSTSIPMTPVLSFNPVDGFVKHRELLLNDIPMRMTFLNGCPSGKLCVMYQKQSLVEAIDEMTTDGQKLYSFDSSKVKITELIGVEQKAENELLLGYSMSCHVLTLHEGMVFNSPETVWNAEPKSIAYVPPYIIAFTTDTIEIRMASNGSLMHTIDVPDLKLISRKDDIIFTSRSLLNQSLHRNDSLTRPEGKAAKVLGKSSKNEAIHIYKICSENLLGRQNSLRSLRTLDKDEEISPSQSRCSVSDEISATTDQDTCLEMNILDEEEKQLEILSSDTRHQISSPSKPRRQMLVISNNHGNSGQILEVNGTLPLLDASSLDYNPVCSSPDSGVHDDYNSPPSTMYNSSKGAMLHGLHSSSSSPSLLTSSGTNRTFH